MCSKDEVVMLNLRADSTCTHSTCTHSTCTHSTCTHSQQSRPPEDGERSLLRNVVWILEFYVFVFYNLYHVLIILKTMDKVQETSSSKYNIPSSEPFLNSVRPAVYIHSSIHQSSLLSARPAIHPSMHPSDLWSIYPCILPSIHPSIHLSNRGMSVLVRGQSPTLREEKGRVHVWNKVDSI